LRGVQILQHGTRRRDRVWLLPQSPCIQGLGAEASLEAILRQLGVK